jgi:ligand-binding sensor domain-containing protein
MLNRLLIFSCILFFSARVFGQENNIAIGNWRVHLPYLSMNSVAVSNDKVYAAKGSSVFYFDKEEKTLNINSKYTGLHDVNVSKIAYNSSLNTFIVGYETGNIDLIKGNSVVNVNDIYLTSVTSSKKINHILSNDKMVYISGDYGVVLYDLNRKEVKESYLTLAPNSSANAVYASTLTINKDSIFLATSKGVMSAKVSLAVNLLDFANWYTYHSTDSIDSLNVVSVCSNAGIVYAAVNKKGIYYYNGSKWKKTSVPMTGGNIHSLTQSGNSVLACVDSSVFQIFSPASWIELFHPDNGTPEEAYFDSDSTLWVASNGGGLIQYKNNNANDLIPNGPYSNNVFRFGYYNNNLIELAGGYNTVGGNAYSLDWFSTFENNTSWSFGRYKYSATIPINFSDFISATYNDFNSTLYLSSYGNGLVAINSDQSVQVYTDANSPLHKENANLYLWVGETTLDDNGKLWVPTRGVNSGIPNLHSLAPDGTWNSYDLSGSSLSYNIIGVTTDNSGNKWLKTVGGNNGVIVFNEQTNSIRTLTGGVGNGKLPDPQVNCIVKDTKGTMFLGTNQGIAVCYDPSVILNSGVDLVTPIFDGFPILFERNVLSIEVDGGNRKWVGTNDGLWLFNEDLTKVLLYFDASNSPLLSDAVLSIKVHPASGEVFFATQEGITSYRGTSTDGDDKYSNVKVFPNPVKPGFNGLVGISGLATNASVKITDVAGNMVYETTAQGGTAVWNVKDYNGRRAASGVYLIFCSTADGTSTFVSKIAVVE